MRKLRATDWEWMVAGVNMALAYILIAACKSTGADAYGIAAVWCSATSVVMLLRIIGRLKR